MFRKGWSSRYPTRSDMLGTLPRAVTVHVSVQYWNGCEVPLKIRPKMGLQPDNQHGLASPGELDGSYLSSGARMHG